MKTRDNLLLDTNIVVALFAGEPGVLARIQGSAKVFLPVIALGELYYGACGSSRREQNLERLDAFAGRVAILHCDEQTARHYGEIKADLSASGKLIPENDIWIAAIAFQNALTLMTRDTHFRAVKGLRTDPAEVQM